MSDEMAVISKEHLRTLIDGLDDYWVTWEEYKPAIRAAMEAVGMTDAEFNKLHPQGE